MDLTPLYDLRDRLKAGAIAGTSLISEDFRLSRALEAMEPLAGASPVFAKIKDSVKKLLSEDCPNRAAALLSALALCDAVIVTQGSSSAGAPENLSAVSLTGQAGSIQNVPYSVLQPLIDALTGSGGGRYSYILDTRREKPELFSDYRIMRAMVQALGNTYAELAEWAKGWLYEEGPEIVPLLKDGFDPQGKREMERRFSVIEQVAGAAENDFYLSLLDTAEKEVKALAVYALRLSEENAQRLVELTKTEKGNVKKQALWALAKLQAPIAQEYWETLAEKKPDQAAEYMQLSQAEYACRLVASGLSQIFSVYEADPAAEITKETQGLLQKYILALPGKSGPEICAVYRRAAALKKCLDRPAEGASGKKPMYLQYAGYGCIAVFSHIMAIQLIQSLKYNPEPDLLELAAELHRDFGHDYLAPHLYAALLTKPAGECFQLAKPLLSPEGGLFKKKLSEEQKVCLELVMQRIHWDNKKQTQVFKYAIDDPAGGYVYRDHTLAEKMDIRWYEALLKFGNHYEEMLMNCYESGNSQVVKILQDRFLARAAIAPKDMRYITYLKRLGWNSCKGFAVRYFQQDKQVHSYQLTSYFNMLPGSAAEKAQEAEAVMTLYQTGKIRFVSRDGEEILRQMILSYQNGAEQV